MAKRNGIHNKSMQTLVNKKMSVIFSHKIKIIKIKGTARECLHSCYNQVKAINDADSNSLRSCNDHITFILSLRTTLKLTLKQIELQRQD